MYKFRLEGNNSTNLVEVVGSNQLKVAPENNSNTNSSFIGGFRVFNENDQGLGSYTGAPFLLSTETSDEFRERDELDTLLDEESFVYTAQNFTKYKMTATTYTPTWNISGFNTNTTYTNTGAAAVTLNTYKTFSVLGTETLSLDMEISILYSQGLTIPAGVVAEFGFGLASTTTPYELFDGVYVRITSSGIYLVARNTSASDNVSSNVFLNGDGKMDEFSMVPGRKYQIILYVESRVARCWISDPTTGQTWLAATIRPASGYGTLTALQTLPMFIRQYQAIIAIPTINMTVSRYSVRRGGQAISTTLGRTMNRIGENINSPGTLTTTANQAVAAGSITRPAAVALTNTTAALTSLSGIVLETPSLASGTDGILMAYQNPALQTAIGTTFLPTRRLRIEGVRISAFVQTALSVGGPLNKNFYIAYGSTSVSLASVATDTATTKAYRRVQIPYSEVWTAAQTVNTLPKLGGPSYFQFKNPIYVNPGEFIALVCYGTGTPITTGTIQRSIAFDYTWE